MDSKLKKQFGIRSANFDISASWVTDKMLIRAHTDLAGRVIGRALDLCCGTGQIGRALRAMGWDVQGLDICKQMIKVSSRYFPVLEGKAEKMPFESSTFELIACRQTFQFLDIKKVLSEIARLLSPRGSFILSLTVPFSSKDSRWLCKVHRIKQPLLLKFYTAQDLIKELEKAGFLIGKTKFIKVRESVTRWMKYAPELSSRVKKEVIAAIENSPAAYRQLHNVRIKSGEVFEDWNWMVLKASFPKNKND